jgi:hypothetical protein
MDEVFSYAAGEECWEGDDIAFIHLPPHLVGNIEKDCVFLDADKNFTKPQPEDCSSLLQVHSVFGLVEKFTGITTRQGGGAWHLQAAAGVADRRTRRHHAEHRDSVRGGRRSTPTQRLRRPVCSTAAIG